MQLTITNADGDKVWSQEVDGTFDLGKFFFPFLTNSLFFYIFENRTYGVFCTFPCMYSAQIKALIYYTVVTPNKARKNSREIGQIRQFSPHFRPHFWPICRQFLGQIDNFWSRKTENYVNFRYDQNAECVRFGDELSEHDFTYQWEAHAF